MKTHNGLDYDAYMASVGWQGRRFVYFDTHTRVCQCCGSDDGIHLHHLSYAHMGAEPDTDLMPLCQACHACVHAVAAVAKFDLRAATLNFVAQYGDGLAAAPVKSPPLQKCRPAAATHANCATCKASCRGQAVVVNRRGQVVHKNCPSKKDVKVERQQSIHYERKLAAGGYDAISQAIDDRNSSQRRKVPTI